MDLQYSRSRWGLSKRPALGSRTDGPQHRADVVAAIPAPRFIPWGWAKLLAQARCCTLFTHDHNMVFQYHDDSKNKEFASTDHL